MYDNYEYSTIGAQFFLILTLVKHLGSIGVLPRKVSTLIKVFGAWNGKVSEKTTVIKSRGVSRASYPNMIHSIANIERLIG